MLGFRFLKVPPTTHVIQHQGGKVVREGGGLSLFYFAPTSTIVQIPVASTDVPFVFNEISSDFQEATIQGQLTYRISDPKKTAGMLDFSLTSGGRYQSDDPTKLGDRLCNSAQVLARAYTQRQRLRDLLIGSAGLRDETLAGLRTSEAVQSLGVEILDLVVLSIKPTPEMSKAFEAEAREDLLQKADLAISARRNAAVEQERTIKENELNTEIAVEQKKGQVRDTQAQRRHLHRTAPQHARRFPGRQPAQGGRSQGVRGSRRAGSDQGRGLAAALGGQRRARPQVLDRAWVPGTRAKCQQNRRAQHIARSA